jgi:GntR family transcriptional regulator, transcriptional repressor for pyruvate dehydrogenase complex
MRVTLVTPKGRQMSVSLKALASSTHSYGFTPEPNAMKAIGPLKPVSRTTLSEQVARQLASEIEAKRWHPDEKLPSEAELCRAFNVGRSTLREGLKSLAFIGLIRMRAGGGSYVTDRPTQYSRGRLFATRVLTRKRHLRDLAEARLILETELAGLCAQRITASDLAILEDLVRKMEAARKEDGTRFQELDLKFHFSIAAAAKNQVLAELLSQIGMASHELMRKSLLSPGAMDLACEQHQKIISAFKERNGVKARKAIHEHLIALQRDHKPSARKP